MNRSRKKGVDPFHNSKKCCRMFRRCHCVNACEVKRMIRSWNKYCFRINLFYSALYSKTDSSHSGSIVVRLTSAHHYVQTILLKLIENRLSNFICVFLCSEKKFRNDSFICTSLLSTFTYLTIRAI